MKNCVVRKTFKLFVILAFSWLLVGTAGAETLHLADGQTLTGDVVSMDEKGIVLKQADGTYGERTPWGKLSQADLRELQQNPKAAAFVEPFIELTQEDKLKRTEIEVKEVPHLQRPANRSLVGGLFGSGIGIFVILVLYAGNVYAGYEIAVFRARPTGLVCGLSAVAPVIGPIIFLAMPPKLNHRPQQEVAEWKPPAEEYQEAGIAAAIASDQAPGGEEGQAASQGHAPAQPAAPALPATKTYPRGQYTFNRRFFETQMPGFFAVTRSGIDQDMVLSIRSARGTYIGQRIARISANELYFQVQKQNASEEVTIPFVEIQEVQLKHKDA
ncbi:MAG: hypothetical protein JWR69_3853 [Pedosphaera sp.]|nr:hypothetical protein [Pedosphaera sp.]